VAVWLFVAPARTRKQICISYEEEDLVRMVAAGGERQHWWYYCSSTDGAVAGCHFGSSRSSTSFCINLCRT
jgi:hypothetical protein